MIDDIKPLIEIKDYSFYILILIFGLILISILVIFLFRYYKSAKRRKIIKILRNIDLGDSKKAAYEISFYLRKITKNEEEKRAFFSLEKKLNKYKYKKKVQSFDKNLDNEFKELLRKLK